jgi:hydroxyacylglutathione hydrolase
MKVVELNEFRELLSQGYVIVDTRKPEVFCDGFIAGSVSIPFDENFLDTLQELTDGDIQILLVTEESETAETLRTIKSSGVSNVAGYLNGGFGAWQNDGGKFDLLILIEADEFVMDYKYDEFYLLDIRSKEEFKKEHVEDSENIPLIDLEPLLVEMDADESYYVYGNTPTEAITAASLFKKNDFHRIRPIASDYESIRQSGVPFFTEKKKGDSSSKFTEN